MVEAGDGLKHGRFTGEIDAGDATIAGDARITGDGKSSPITALASQRVIDVYPVPGTKEALVLTYDGSEYGKKLTSWKVRVHLTKDLQNFKELLTYTTDKPPQSVATWKKAIYLGNNIGEVWRAIGK